MLYKKSIKKMKFNETSRVIRKFLNEYVRFLIEYKVFDQCLDVLYQNLFSGAITLILQKIKLVESGTKFVPPEFQYFEYSPVTLVFLSTFMQNNVYF